MDNKQALIEAAKKVNKYDIKPEELVEIYDKWSKDYDTHHEGNDGVAACAERVAHHLKGRPDASILDIGAGTGLLGVEVKARGFQNIDALEPSSEMLAVAERKGCYKKLIESFLTEETDLLKTNSYDVVISRGAFTPGHIPPAAIKEVIRCLKPGGLFMTFNRAGFHAEELDLHKTFLRYEQEGFLIKVERLLIPDYLKDVTGLSLIYEVNKANEM